MQTINPSPLLENIIDAYWMTKNETKRDINTLIVPDGCIDVVFKNSELLLVGAMQISLLVSIKPNDCYFGIRFKPGVIASLLNRDISFFNDKLIPLKLVDVNLHSSIQDTSRDIDKLNTLFEKLFANINLDTRIINAVNMINLNNGNISISAVCDKIDLSTKHLARLFNFHLGLSPKKFARIIRFFHTHKHLSKEGLANLCVKVIEKGYYDQSHFNHEYKTFTNLSPTSEMMSIFYNTK